MILYKFSYMKGVDCFLKQRRDKEVDKTCYKIKIIKGEFDREFERRIA